MQARGPTAVWLGRLGESTEPDLQRFVADLRRPETIRRLRENYHLTAYRLEARDDRLRITFGGETPAALANFLKAHALWPGAWRYAGRGAPVPPGYEDYTVLFDLDDEPRP
jgi:hypothetical protein